MKDVFISINKARIKNFDVTFDSKDEFKVRDVRVEVSLLDASDHEVTSVYIHKTTSFSLTFPNDISYLDITLANLARRLEDEASIALNGISFQLPKDASKDSLGSYIEKED